MSVTISSFQTAKVPLGTPLARVDELTGHLSLWPEGVGHGPCITMSVRDWEMLKHSGDEAIRVQRRSLERYTAAEGSDYELPPGSSVLNMQTGEVTHTPGRWGDGRD